MVDSSDSNSQSPNAIQAAPYVAPYTLDHDSEPSSSHDGAAQGSTGVVYVPHSPDYQYGGGAAVHGYEGANYQSSSVGTPLLSVQAAIVKVMELTHNSLQLGAMDAIDDIDIAKEEMKKERTRYRAERDEMLRQQAEAKKKAERNWFEKMYDFFENSSAAIRSLFQGKMDEFDHYISEAWDDLKSAIPIFQFFDSLIKGIGAFFQGKMQEASIHFMVATVAYLNALTFGPLAIFESIDDTSHMGTLLGDIAGGAMLAAVASKDAAAAEQLYDEYGDQLIQSHSMKAPFDKYKAEKFRAHKADYDANKERISTKIDLAFSRVKNMMQMLNRLHEMAFELIQDHHRTLLEGIIRMSA